jgi:HEAT repeat protein
VDAADVLEGLDAVNWAGLTHAYGPASDVPELIRALASTEADERARALHSLYGNIFHQGSRYEATACAVPFLARLAANSQIAQRDDIVLLLAALAIGYDEAFLPAGVDIAGWRAGVEQVRVADPAETLRQLDAWVDAARSEGERSVRQMRRAIYDPASELRSAEDELGAYDAVRAEVPGLRGLLGDDDPGVRAAGAYLLGWFPEEATGSAAALRALLPVEAVPGVAANAIISAGLLGETNLVPQLRAYLDGSEPLMRWASAVALVRLGPADPSVLRVLASASADPPQRGPGPPVNFLHGNLRGHAAQALAALDGHLPASVVDGLLQGLARSTQVAAFPMAVAALRVAFPGGGPDPLPPFGELTKLQQRVVRTLAELGPETWRWGNFMEILRAWNLPDNHVDCRTYAGLGAPTD